MSWFVVLALPWLLAVHGSAFAAPASSWADAEAREARSLQAELAALERSLASSKASTAAAKTSLRKEVEGLSEQLTRLRVQNQRLEHRLPARERVRSQAAEAHHLEDLLGRLHTLAEPPDGADHAPVQTDELEALPRLVDHVLARVRETSALRLDPNGEYFDAGGHLTSAPILRVGRVAAVRWDGQSVPLVATPAGLREAVGVEPWREDRDGATLARVVLHDPEAPAPPTSFTDAGWRAKMDAGGPIMWVLLAIALLTIAIIVERTVGLVWASMRWRREQRRFESAVRQYRTSSLLHVQSWIAKPLVIAAAARCPSCATPKDADVEEGATQALMVMRERLQRRLSLVNVAAGVAPLLGLLGTVTGMIHTFSVVTSTGTSEPQQLAAGISEALLTTQFGLAIAIPAFLAHALLRLRARRILAAAEQAVLWYLHGADAVSIEHVHAHDHDVHHHHQHAHGDGDEEVERDD